MMSNWKAYPTFVVAGKLLKTVDPSTSLESIKTLAEQTLDCQAYTTTGQLLTDVTSQSDWLYDKDVTTYLRTNIKPSNIVKILTSQQTPPSRLINTLSQPSATATATVKYNLIPKFLHQFYSSENLAIMPKRLRETVNYNLSTLPRWDFRLYTPPKLKLFIETEYPSHIETYNSLQTTTDKFNLCKYLVLHKYGGVYTDISVKLSKFINSIRKTPITVFMNRTRTSTNGATISAIACHPQDPLISEILELYKTPPDNQKISDDISKIIAKYEKDQNHTVTVIK